MVVLLLSSASPVVARGKKSGRRGSNSDDSRSSSSSMGTSTLPDDDVEIFDFTTIATGVQETTPVDTMTTARLRLAVDAGFTQMQFLLYVLDGIDITMAHLHCAAAGMDGPVVVDLLQDGPLDEPIDVDGLLRSGQILADDISDTSCGSSIITLFQNIQSGNVYLNIHSSANPAGEVRGQLGVFPQSMTS